MSEKMYCPVCKRISEGESCAYCTGETRPLTETDQVFLTSVDAESFGFLKEDFKNKKISFEAEEQPLPPDGSVYSGKGLLRSRDIYVSGADLEKAEEALNETFQNIEEMEKMPQGKRIIVQVLSVLGFILLVYLAITGADWIANVVKALLS